MVVLEGGAVFNERGALVTLSQVLLYSLPCALTRASLYRGTSLIKNAHSLGPPLGPR